MVDVDVAASGSSPLARGLPHSRRRGTRHTGIIPARAGFTRSWDSARISRTDHPRSRGVYPQLGFGTNITDGSSPLARGLPHVNPGRHVPPRIIPARAGFTKYRVRLPDRREDHPRSRGVYRMRSRSPRLSVGSSPLARGLHIIRGLCRHLGRIIPARAGFTGGMTVTLYQKGDHPRSRGVYGWHDCDPVSEGGSSPLARGLQMSAQILRPLVRIIPARAGFTSVPSPTATP